MSVPGSASLVPGDHQPPCEMTRALRVVLQRCRNGPNTLRSVVVSVLRSYLACTGIPRTKPEGAIPVLLDSRRDDVPEKVAVVVLFGDSWRQGFHDR